MAERRETGSGGTGATNVSRRAGVSAGVVTLVLDALKGMAAVVIAAWILDVPLVHVFTREPLDILEKSGLTFQQAYWCLWGAAIAAIIGHMFPVWLKFRGGKGVATGMGSMGLLAPEAVLVAAGIFLGIVLITRYVSLGSIVAVAVFPLMVWRIGQFGVSHRGLALVSLVSLLILVKHRANMRRLMAGTENRMGAKRA